MQSTCKNTVHETKTRVAVYARFSCDKQRDASIEDQIYEAERYCERYGYEIVKVYPDYALSGRSDDRPQFMAMIEDAKSGAFDVVLVWKMDRFARNMLDQFYNEKILSDYGVQLESVKENIAGNGIEASMSKGMHAIFAQIRSQQSAEDTMRGMIGKARKCQYLGYKWLGYSHDGDTITLDPATIDVARGIHDMYLSGSSVRDIVAWVNSQGVKNRNGDPVGYQFVTGILKSWVYAGVYTWGRQKDEQGRPIIGADGLPVPLVRVENGIPAIVSVATKERCLERLGYRKHANARIDYLLSGKLFCSKCGHKMHGEVCRNSQGVDCFRYVCKGKRRACHGAFWKDDLETLVAQHVREVLDSPTVAEKIAETFERYRSSKKPSASIEAAKLDVKNIVKQRENLIQAVEDGMPYKHVKDKLASLDAQQEGIERKIAELERTSCEITKADILMLLEKVAHGLRTDEEILSAFVRQVWLYKDYAVAVMSFSDRDSTPYEIQCAIEKLESAGNPTDSSKNALVPQRSRKTNTKTPVVYADNGMPIIIFESGFGLMIHLKAA